MYSLMNGLKIFINDIINKLITDFINKLIKESNNDTTDELFKWIINK